MSEPKPLICFFVSLADNIRIQRVKARASLSESQIKQIDEHLTEVQVNAEIRSSADMIVDNSKPIESVVDEIVQVINQNEH